MKSISLITRRDDLSRDTFRDYYESQHCALAMRYFPYQRYTRNHLSDDVSAGFDCISEFGMSDEFRAIAGNVMASESRARLLVDERAFMRPERIQMALVDEIILQSASSTGLGHGRYALLFRAAQRPEDYSEYMQGRLCPLLEDVPALQAASLDIVRQRGDRHFEFDALLWLTLDTGPSAAALMAQLSQLESLTQTLAVSTFATPLSELQDRFECYLP